MAVTGERARSIRAREGRADCSALCFLRLAEERTEGRDALLVIVIRGFRRCLPQLGHRAEGGLPSDDAGFQQGHEMDRGQR